MASCVPFEPLKLSRSILVASLITNPEPNSVPEEILLYEDETQGAGYVVLRLSNLVEDGELVMEDEYLDQMRDYLGVIHDEFSLLH